MSVMDVWQQASPDRHNGHPEAKALSRRDYGSISTLQHVLGKPISAGVSIRELAGKAQSPALGWELWVLHGCSQSLIKGKAAGLQGRAGLLWW